MSEIQEVCKENIEDNYEKFKDIGSKVFQEYEELYKSQCSKLNATHLDPFAKILLEHDKIVLNNKCELMEIVKNNIEKQMQKALNTFWVANNVSEALLSLEILKEKFKSYEGHKWNLDTKTPWELTRPMRMRFKENRLRYLQAQLDFQNKHLSEVLQETENLRQNLQDVKQQRNFLLKNIGENREKIKVAKVKLSDLQQNLISSSEDVKTENKFNGFLD